MNESPIDGAKREAWEEAYARIEIDALLAVFDVPRISQVQLIYRARLLSPDLTPGHETQELDLFSWEEIPWDQIAFPTVRWALRADHDLRGRTEFLVRSNPSGESPDFVAGR